MDLANAVRHIHIADHAVVFSMAARVGTSHHQKGIVCWVFGMRPMRCGLVIDDFNFTFSNDAKII